MKPGIDAGVSQSDKQQADRQRLRLFRHSRQRRLHERGKKFLALARGVCEEALSRSEHEGKAGPPRE
jgi:hypothetical protein